MGGLASIPDETTILNFRRLLETHDLGAGDTHLARKGQYLKVGTIVDPAIIAAPSSIKNKNKSGKRSPGMHQTKKGNQ